MGCLFPLLQESSPTFGMLLPGSEVLTRETCKKNNILTAPEPWRHKMAVCVHVADNEVVGSAK